MTIDLNKSFTILHNGKAFGLASGISQNSDTNGIQVHNIYFYGNYLNDFLDGTFIHQLNHSLVDIISANQKFTDCYLISTNYDYDFNSLFYLKEAKFSYRTKEVINGND